MRLRITRALVRATPVNAILPASTVKESVDAGSPTLLTTFVIAAIKRRCLEETKGDVKKADALAWEIFKNSDIEANVA